MNKRQFKAYYVNTELTIYAASTYDAEQSARNRETVATGEFIFVEEVYSD